MQGLGQKFSDATSVESDPGDGVIATCVFRVAASTNGAWTRLGYGEGITPTQLDGFVSETYGSDAVTVSGISRTFPNGGTMPSLVPITDDYARYIYDIVHVPGLARFQSLFVTTFTAEDVGRMTRVCRGITSGRARGSTSCSWTSTVSAGVTRRRKRGRVTRRL